MKFFLIMIFFAPLVLAEQIMAPNITYIMPSRGNVQWDIESLLEAYRKNARDKGADFMGGVERVKAPVKLHPQILYNLSPDISHLDRDAEEYMSQRARAVRDVMEDTERIMADRAQAMDYIREETERMTVKEVWPERDDMEYIERAAKLQKYMSGLISRSEGVLCGLSQDPVQCCNTFAQFPDQCLSKTIEKGINRSDLKEGVCNVAQNVEGCASQVSSTVLLQLMSIGTIHQFSVPEGSFPNPADVFVGRDPAVDYESLQLHQFGKTAGGTHFSTMNYPAAENYPEIQRVMEELNGLTGEALRELYKDFEAPPAFPAGR